MRVSSIFAILIAALFASSLAAQDGATARASTSTQPLPEALTPRQVSADARSAAMDPIETGALTGMLVGATLGGLYGAFFADECGVEDDCTLSREVKAVGFVAIGGGLGGIIGLGMSYLLNRNAAGPDSAPVRVEGGVEGGVSVGMRVRH
jgi:uncharacterized protein YcfJ